MTRAAAKRVLVVSGNCLTGVETIGLLQQRGVTVVATFHRNDDRLQPLAAELPDISILGPVDLTSDSDMEKLGSADVVRKGLDGVVNLASYAAPDGWFADLITCDRKNLLDTFRVEVIGTLNLVRAVLPVLRSNASIVLFGSSGADRSDLDTAIYNPAKQAVVSVAKHLAKQLSPHVRVNAVLPGAIATDWIESWHVTQSEISNFKASRHGLHRLGTARELAAVVDFLLSQRSSYVNAQAIGVDGGSQA